MLRTALLIISVLLVIVGLVLFFMTGGEHAWLPLLFWSVVLLALILGERWRYRKTKCTSDGWKQTDEQFIDPETGKAMRVYYNASTGERHYELQE